MRIAVGLAGYLRYEKQSFNNLKKILNNINNEIDIFICADDCGYIGWNHNKREKEKKINMNKIKELYGSYLKDYLLFKKDDYELNPEIPGYVDLWSKKWVYKKYNCIKLIKKYEKTQNIKYDIVLLTRSDILYLKNIDLKEYDNNKIYIEEHGKNNVINKELLKKYDISSKELSIKYLKSKIPSNDTNFPKLCFKIFGYGHPNWYISNTENLYNFTKNLYEIAQERDQLFLSKGYDICKKSHFFTIINISLLKVNKPIIFTKKITPITIHHCVLNANTDRSYKTLGIPNEYKNKKDFIIKLKYSIENDIIL